MPSLSPGPAKDYIPGPDEDCLAWIANFDSVNVGIAAVLSPSDASMTAARSAFGFALELATTPATRTSFAIDQKDVARQTAVLIARQIAVQYLALYKAGAVTSGELVSLGLSVPDLVRSRIEAPIHAPLIAVDSVSGSQARVRVTQVIEGVPVSSRGFPAGVQGLQVTYFSSTRTEVVARRRVNVELDCSAFTPGDPISCYAQYVNPRGETGPQSATVQFRTF